MLSMSLLSNSCNKNGLPARYMTLLSGKVFFVKGAMPERKTYDKGRNNESYC